MSDGATIRHRHLADLDARWVVDKDGRHVGVKFLCPTCPADVGAPTLAVLFANPPDGGAATPIGSDLVGENEGRRWTRVGGLELGDITLTPSVDCSKCGHWHGFVQHGDVS